MTNREADRPQLRRDRVADREPGAVKLVLVPNLSGAVNRRRAIMTGSTPSGGALLCRLVLLP